jgi:hypothetical protein
MSQSLSLRAQCRKRAWEYLNPCVAAAAFMSLEQLQQFVGGTYYPSDDQTTRLAQRMSVLKYPVH